MIQLLGIIARRIGFYPTCVLPSGLPAHPNTTGIIGAILARKRLKTWLIIEPASYNEHCRKLQFMGLLSSGILPCEAKRRNVK